MLTIGQRIVRHLRGPASGVPSVVREASFSRATADGYSSPVAHLVFYNQEPGEPLGVLSTTARVPKRRSFAKSTKNSALLSRLPISISVTPSTIPPHSLFTTTI